jgi:excisionase family DNA binding protein
MIAIEDRRVTDEHLETPKQLAARTGLSERKIRHLIHTRQLEHVIIGSRVHIPSGAFARFIETKKVTPCQDETKVPVSIGSISVNASTSPGQSMAAAASAQLALQTANKLKSSSPSGCEHEGVKQAQVIHLKY